LDKLELNIETSILIWPQKGTKSTKINFQGLYIQCLAVNNSRNFVLCGSGLIPSKSRAIFIANHSILVGGLPL
jgi:hypothetical protein